MAEHKLAVAQNVIKRTEHGVFPSPVGKKKVDAPSIKLLCFNLSNLSPTFQFTALSLAVFFFFQLNSFIEEYIFNVDSIDFVYGGYLTWVELILFASFAGMERVIRNEGLFERKAPLRMHCFVGVAIMASRGLTNVSLQYLSYPTQVVFKTMKLITVMMGMVICFGKSYARLEYLMAITLVVSGILFNLGDIDEMPDYSLLGLAIVVVSLFFDALHSNSQEHLLRHHGAGPLEAIMFTNLCSASCNFVVILVTGEFFTAFSFCAAHPTLYVMFFARAALVYCGVVSFVGLSKNFGVVAATGVTTVRKILSVILSFVVFPKPWNIKHVGGFFLFSASLLMGLHLKRRIDLKKEEGKNRAKSSV